MDEYLDTLTYGQLDDLRFAEMNIDIASPFISDISAAINRKLFPVYEGVVVDDEHILAPVFVRVLRLVGG